MELLVATIIVVTLSCLLLPSVQAARESARLAQCASHLRGIGAATLQSHEVTTTFPPARLRARNDYDANACESTQASWLVRITPYLEEADAFMRWDLYAPFEAHEAAMREFVPSVYTCPTRRTSQEAIIASGMYVTEYTLPCGCYVQETLDIVGGAVGDYAANHGDLTNGPSDEYSYWRGGNGTGVIVSARPLCRRGEPVGWIDKVRARDVVDGLSHTALVGEMHVRQDQVARAPENGPMYNGKYLASFARVGGPGIGLARGPKDDTVPAIGFGSWHPGICPFAMADGAVRFVANQIDSEALRSICRREDQHEPEFSELLRF